MCVVEAHFTIDATIIINLSTIPKVGCSSRTVWTAVLILAGVGMTTEEALETLHLMKAKATARLLVSYS